MTGKPPANPFPAFYAACILPLLVEPARAHGYALCVHGSLLRDLDLVAVPWTSDASDPAALVTALSEALPGWNVIPDTEQRPHGRVAWTFAQVGTIFCDISVMPITRPGEGTDWRAVAGDLGERLHNMLGAGGTELYDAAVARYTKGG